MNPEICINIWFIVDIATALCYNWSARAYNLEGSDADKTTILKKLAETDYVTALRESFPKHYLVVTGDETREGYLPLSGINQELDMNLEYYIDAIEKTLPVVCRFGANLNVQPEAIAQKLPASPLYVSTLLMENEHGDVKPFTTAENKAWFESEKQRLA